MYNTWVLIKATLETALLYIWLVLVAAIEIRQKIRAWHGTALNGFACVWN